MTYEEREDVLKACKYVNQVVPNVGGHNSREAIERLIEKGSKPDLVVIGSDWHSRDYLKQMDFTWEWLGVRGIGICYFEYTKNISTTEIKTRLGNKYE